MKTKYIKLKFGLLLACVVCASTNAQDRKKDIEEINQLIDRLYAVISFDNGEIKEYDITSIYDKEATIGMVDSNRVRMFTAVDFEEKSRASFKRGNIISFKEREIKGINHIYGGVATRFSSYEYTIKKESAEHTVRGVNSIQLIKDPKLGWRVYSLIFSDESSYPEIPEQYLK